MARINIQKGISQSQGNITSSSESKKKKKSKEKAKRKESIVVVTDNENILFPHLKKNESILLIKIQNGNRHMTP